LLIWYIYSGLIKSRRRAANAVEWCFCLLVEDIEKTRSDIPDGITEEGS